MKSQIAKIPDPKNTRNSQRPIFVSGVLLKKILYDNLRTYRIVACTQYLLATDLRKF